MRRFRCPAAVAANSTVSSGVTPSLSQLSEAAALAGAGVALVKSTAVVADARPPTMDRPERAIDEDDLTRIRGLGPNEAIRLHDLGIWRYSQIAGWSTENADWVSERLRAPGEARGSRHWIDEAKLLASGAVETAAFSVWPAVESSANASPTAAADAKQALMATGAQTGEKPLGKAEPAQGSAI